MSMDGGGARRVVVSGGAGFIGSHLVERLLRDGYRVRVLDNLATGREANLAHLSHYPGLEWERVDISRGPRLNAMLAQADWVFHLAGLADIVPSIAHPLAYHRTNVDGTVAMLEAARAAGASRFIYAASSSCYGLPRQLPTPETAPAQPMYPYALTKYVGEQYVMHWARTYRLPALSLRLFNVYGPRSRTSGAYGAVFGVFLAQKLAGKPFTVVGDGSQSRDFVFVTDVVEAMVRAARAKCVGEAINIGSGRACSINYLTQLLGGAIEYLPKRPGEPDCTLANIDRAWHLLDWQPAVSLEDGVRVMLEHIDYWRGAPLWDRQAITQATAQWFEALDGSR